jgi:hypothetical protein
MLEDRMPERKYPTEMIPFEPDPDHAGVGSGDPSETCLSHILFG